jgi:hypothetical protein
MLRPSAKWVRRCELLGANETEVHDCEARKIKAWGNGSGLLYFCDATDHSTIIGIGVPNRFLDSQLAVRRATLAVKLLPLEVTLDLNCRIPETTQKRRQRRSCNRSGSTTC